jgi:hypothetical protein
LTRHPVDGVVPTRHHHPENSEAQMIETRLLETAPGMVFDVSVEGKDDDTLVLMLHGFGVSRFFWNAQVHAVGEMGHSQ